jgi:hypothetical protein
MTLLLFWAKRISKYVPVSGRGNFLYDLRNR